MGLLLRDKGFLHMTAQAIAADNALTALALTPGGNLDAYVRAVQQFPMLSQAREEELALRFRTLNDLESARELVLSHLRLVVAVSRQFKGYGLPQADLIQEGNIGLMKAVKRFDPTRGFGWSRLRCSGSRQKSMNIFCATGSW